MNPFSKFKITTDLRNILINTTGITAMVGNNIFPVIAPEETNGDFIIYYRDEYSKEYTNFGISKESCKVYIAAVSESYDNSQRLAELINDTLEGNHITNTNFEYRNLEYQCQLIDSTEDFEGNKYIQVLLFSIK